MFVVLPIFKCINDKNHPICSTNDGNKTQFCTICKFTIVSEGKFFNQDVLDEMKKEESENQISNPSSYFDCVSVQPEQDQESEYFVFKNPFIVCPNCKGKCKVVEDNNPNYTFLGWNKLNCNVCQNEYLKVENKLKRIKKEEEKKEIMIEKKIETKTEITEEKIVKIPEMNFDTLIMSMSRLELRTNSFVNNLRMKKEALIEECKKCIFEWNQLKPILMEKEMDVEQKNTLESKIVQNIEKLKNKINVSLPEPLVEGVHFSESLTSFKIKLTEHNQDIVTLKQSIEKWIKEGQQLLERVNKLQKE